MATTDASEESSATRRRQGETARQDAGSTHTAGHRAAQARHGGTPARPAHGLRGRPGPHRRRVLGPGHPDRAVPRGPAHRPAAAGLAGARPLHPQQGPRRGRALHDAGGRRLHRRGGAGHLAGPALAAQRPPRPQEGAGRGDQHRSPRPRLPGGRGHGPGRPDGRLGAAHLRPLRRRRAAGGLHVGGGHGRRALRPGAADPHRRSQRAAAG